jgi:hypothetical protein
MKHYILENDGVTVTEISNAITPDMIKQNPICEVRYWDRVENYEIHRTYYLGKKNKENLEKLQKLTSDRYRVYCFLKNMGLIKNNKFILE